MTDALKDTAFLRWEEFSNRMAFNGWPLATTDRKQKISGAVQDFLTSMKQFQDEVSDWDGEGSGLCVGDELESFLEERGLFHEDPDKYHRFANQVSCCVRAGFDVAISPSAGVVGFDVNMLKRMWADSIPDWVCHWFEPPLNGTEAGSNAIWL